jgi:hypothetical protein
MRMRITSSDEVDEDTASTVIYRHGKLTCLPCVSPSGRPQVLLNPSGTCPAK